MKEVKLANSDRVAIVDDEDFALVSQYQWRLAASPHSDRLFHAKTTIGRQLMPMHRLITGHLPGFVADHVNHDGLDNRRANLRVTTSWHNSINRRMNRNNKSGYRGVHQNEHGKWIAQITHLEILMRIGQFDTAEQAARAFDQKAIELRGTMAILNFPLKGAA